LVRLEELAAMTDVEATVVADSHAVDD